MYVCDAVRASATEGDLKRPKLRLYGESGVECAVEGASDRRAVSEGQAAHCAATAAACPVPTKRALLGDALRSSGGLQSLHLLQLCQSYP